MPKRTFFSKEWSGRNQNAPLEVPQIAAAFKTMAQVELGMDCQITVSNQRTRVGLLVSKIPHCLQDLALRFRRGEMRGELVCVVSNHPDLGEFCGSMDLPFHHVDLDSHHEGRVKKFSCRSSRNIKSI